MQNPSAIRPCFKRHQRPQPAPQSWTIPDIGRAYSVPEGTMEGMGQIAIVELGGGWHASDVAQAFAAMGLPAPVITDVSVDGTNNSPGSDADGEVALDIQVAGGIYALATGKPAQIFMYWAKDIGAAVEKATADGRAVCSISWGADESAWGPAALDAMEDIAFDAVNAGMAIFAASGDNDADDGGGAAGVNAPASCPHIVACGGTHLPVGNAGGIGETVWQDSSNNAPNGEGTGGGFSSHFPVQPWQTGCPTPPIGLGRMVPDVSANADPATGYQIVENGRVVIVGGTSAVAPLYAGFFAAIGDKFGFVTPAMFLHKTAFNDIQVGSNGVYQASVGPDACSGVGSPIASALGDLFTVPLIG